MINNLTDTIIGISTPKGKGAIGIARLSGIKAKYIAEKIIDKKINNKNIIYTKFYNEKKEILDIGLIIYFKAPHSFTGEDIIEFHAHGNDIILNNIINAAMILGARNAEPGEFSFRSYINNKIDMLQAESINNLINSTNKNENELILNSLAGELSKEIKIITNDILNIQCEIEGSIDFPDDIQLNSNVLISKIKLIYTTFFRILKKVSLTKQKNFKISILGDANVGKSSLFNFLLKKNRSIISEIPGTTRDFIEDTILIKNNTIQIIDTAGLNNKSTCKIEKQGILKSFNQINESNIIIFIFDITQINKNNEIFENILKKTNNKKIIILKNKIDLLNLHPKINLKKKYTELYISIKKNLGLNLIEEELQKIYNSSNQANYLINKRHLSLFIKIKKELKILIKLVKNKQELILIAEKFKNILLFLSEIIGENLSNKSIEKIFANFCVGK